MIPSLKVFPNLTMDDTKTSNLMVPGMDDAIIVHTPKSIRSRHQSFLKLLYSTSGLEAHLARFPKINGLQQEKLLQKTRQFST